MLLTELCENHNKNKIIKIFPNDGKQKPAIVDIGNSLYANEVRPRAVATAVAALRYSFHSFLLFLSHFLPPASQQLLSTPSSSSFCCH